MSSMHHDKRIDPLTYKRKPDIVRFYNATKGAVDAMDKMAQASTAKRITKQWPMVLFINVIDLSTIAARAVWMKKFPDHNLAKKDSRQQFTITIAEDLCLEQIQRRLQLKKLTKPLRLTMELFVQHIQQKTTCEAGQEEEERGWQQHQDQQQLLVQNGQQQVRGSPPEQLPECPQPANLQRTKGSHKADAASATGKMIAKQHVLVVSKTFQKLRIHPYSSSLNILFFILHSDSLESNF